MGLTFAKQPTMLSFGNYQGLEALSHAVGDKLGNLKEDLKEAKANLFQQKAGLLPTEPPVDNANTTVYTANSWPTTPFYPPAVTNTTASWEATLAQSNQLQPGVVPMPPNPTIPQHPGLGPITKTPSVSPTATPQQLTWTG